MGWRARPGPRERASTNAPAAQGSLRSLATAALAPALQPGRWSRVLIFLLAVPVLAGIAAYGYQVANGLEVTGLNDDVFWGLYTVNLVTLIGLSYGGALVSAILRLTDANWRGPIVRIAEGTALVTLAVGALFPIIHLGRPDRMWEMFTRPQFDSPLLWDMVAILTYLLATLLLFGLPLLPDCADASQRSDVSGWRRRLYSWAAADWQDLPEQRRILRRSMTILAIVIIPVAIMVHTVLSYAFSLTSRPGWHSTIFGPYFVVAAIYSGVAVVILAAVAYRRAYRLQRWITDEAIRRLGYILVTLGVAYGYFMFTEITTEGYVGEEAADALLYVMMLDRYAPLFWTFVALGLAIPTLLVAFRRTRTTTGITVAAGLVVVSMWLKRFLLIVPPLTQPLFGDAIGGYSPSWVEWTITLGSVAAIPLLLILLFRVFPVLAVHEMQEIEADADARSGQPIVVTSVGGSP